jgi:riboflavin biosynthesis pyrimidine reductase
MSDALLQLYPLPTDRLPLTRLYLDHPLHRIAASESGLVYSNFVTSLDGRIALPRPGKTSHGVPPAISNARDWRLYQELGAQADLLITSARYYRQYARGEAQDQLPVGPGEKFADLRRWRLDQGLRAQPDVAIFSAGLDIPADAVAAYAERRLHVLTGADADPGRVAALRAAGVEVHVAGMGRSVEGARAIGLLQGLGYRHIYVIAGPSVLHTLLRDGALQRLYLSFAHRLLGGEDFDTLTWGSELHPAPVATLRSLFFDAHATEHSSQLLACYDIQSPHPDAA